MKANVIILKEYYVHDIDYKGINIPEAQIIKIEEHEIL